MPDRSSRLKMVVHVELGVVVGEASTAAVSRQWRRVVSPMTVTQSHVANDDDENAVLCQDNGTDAHASHLQLGPTNEPPMRHEQHVDEFKNHIAIHQTMAITMTYAMKQVAGENVMAQAFAIRCC